MKLLELFSGTRSVGKVADILGWDVTSLDLKNADINTDILVWDYKQFQPKQFDIIWASPPCTEYSRAMTTRDRDIESANKIVTKTLEIIKYLNPQYFIIENPQTGLLKMQEFMQDLPFKDIDYCKYGLPYRKRTRLWNNVFQWKPRNLCKKDCGNISNGRHIASAQRGPSGPVETWADQPKFTQKELFRVPQDLIKEIFDAVLLCPACS